MRSLKEDSDVPAVISWWESAAETSAVKGVPAERVTASKARNSGNGRLTIEQREQLLTSAKKYVHQEKARLDESFRKELELLNETPPCKVVRRRCVGPNSRLSMMSRP
jgi:hypothetical protein